MKGLGATLVALSEELNKRYQKYLDDPNNIIATFLDPRYKQFVFKDEAIGSLRHIEEIEKMIINEALKYLEKKESDAMLPSTTQIQTSGLGIESDPEDPDPEQQSFTGFESPKKKQKFINWAFEKLFDDTCESDDSNSGNSSLNRINIENEIQKYKMCKKLARDKDPMQWWQENLSVYPYLSLLAQKYLSCPPSSVESERVFSTGGNVYTPHRNRLNPEMGERLIFLHFNLNLLPKLEYPTI